MTLIDRQERKDERMSTRPTSNSNITSTINEAVGWDDRKMLSDVYQDNGGHVDALDDSTYTALIAVAKWGARQVLEPDE